MLKTSPNNRQIAVGYEDGVVRLFDLNSGECLVTFSGHKSAVTSLSFDIEGMRLVSGAKDTNIIVWDTVAEAGLFRLSGHKGPITKCCFLESQNILVSSSLDTLVKFWDLDTQHCFKTLVGHRSEVWDMVVMKNDRYLVTGCGDSELRVWKIRFPDSEEDDEKQKATPKKTRRDSDDEEEKNEDGNEEEDDDNSILQCTKIGTILRQGRDRVLSMVTDPSRTILSCHGMDSIVELFRFHDEEEIQKIFSKRQRKFKKQNPESTEELTVALQDEVLRIKSVQASGKVKAIDVHVSTKGELRLLALLRGNSFEIHVVDTKVSNKNDATKVGALSIPGHRTDVRALCFSSDKIALASASGESLKIWNRGSQNCIRTMACDYALSILFATGDRNVIVATKTGKLQIFDIAAGRLLEEIRAHEGEAWTVAMSPDLRGIASGGADKSVKFWQFELVVDKAVEEEDEDGQMRGHGGKRMSLTHTKTLQLEEDVLCVRFSPDQRLIAVSLLDSTVKIFFADTLKFFLSLYGHKFPVLCMDISYDSTTIITGGADRNIKIWGSVGTQQMISDLKN
jgi:U3 small nucleolar RNA-associated protein 12